MSRTVVIRDLEFNWPSLHKPKAPFGTEQWEVQVATTSKEKVEELKAVGINVREDKGKYVANVKRKTKTQKGEPLPPPKVVDGQKETMDVEKISKIGNGSTGAIKVFSYDWDVGGRKGTSAMLTEVQVTSYIEYNDDSSEDF